MGYTVTTHLQLYDQFFKSDFNVTVKIFNLILITVNFLNLIIIMVMTVKFVLFMRNL